jgi:hypothetical protein
MKHYECIQVGHHKDIGLTIEEREKDGWHLHTYQAAVSNASLIAPVVYHYLLFEKESKE